MKTDNLTEKTEFEWKGLSAKFEFKTVSSVRFDLGIWTSRHPSGGGSFSGKGWIEVHNPVAFNFFVNQPVAFVSVSLPSDYIALNKRRDSDIRELIFKLFDLVGIQREQPYRGRVFSSEGGWVLVEAGIPSIYNRQSDDEIPD